MATEADIPEPPISITKIELENKYLTSKLNDTTVDEFCQGELEKFQGGNKQAPETAEFSAQTENMQEASDFGDETIKKVTTSNVGTSEGESFFGSPSAAELAHEETSKISKDCQADEIPFQADKKISENKKQMQNDGKFDIAEETGSGENEVMEGTDERAEKSGMSHDILNLTGTSIQVATIEEPNLNIGEETSLEEERILNRHVEVIANEHALIEENLKSIEKELNNSQKNEKEMTETGETTDFESGKEILNILEATSSQNKEGSIHGPDLTVDNMNKDGETATDACKKEEGIIDTKLIREEMEETRVKEEIKASEKSPDLAGEETGPEAIKSAGTEEDMKEKILYDSIKDVPTSTVAESSNIQIDPEATIDIGEGTKEELYKPSVTLETDMSIMIEAGPEEASNIACKEESQDTIESSEKMKSIPPVEDEMHNTKKLDTSLVTETENTCLQAVDNPEIFKQVPEISSEDIVKESPEEVKDQTEILEKIAQTDNTTSEKGKEDKNPEEKVDSSFTKDEGMQSVGEDLHTTAASATEKTNEGGSNVEMGNDNISDKEIISSLEDLQMEMSKPEGRPEESLLQQNEPQNENLEMGFEDIHTTASSVYAETITCVSEETPIKSHEKGFEEKGKEDTSIQNDAAGENGIPTEKNLPPTELNEKTGSVKAEITNKNTNDLHVTHPLVEEGEQKECEELNKVSKFEPEEVHEATGASKGEEKHFEDNPGACQRTNSAILEHTSKEEAVTTELTPKTSEIDTEIFQEICELDSEENLKSKEAREKIEEAIQKDEDCDAETFQITTKSDDTVKTVSDTETSVMVKSNVLARDETIELNSEVESTLEAAPAASYEDESNKAEDNEERSNIITDEVQDGPKIIDTGEATNEEIIQGNSTCLSPELIEKETFQSSQDNENKAEKSKGEDSGEQIIEESNVKGLSPEAIEEGPVKIFQDDEKEEKKFEGEVFEGSETAEAGKSIAYETSQTVESPKDMLDTSMVIQEEGRNLAPAEVSPEEKSNEDRSYVVVGEENSTDTKNLTPPEMFDTSQLKQEEGLQSEDKNLTPPEASPEEKRYEDSVTVAEENGSDTEPVETKGNVEKDEENYEETEAVTLNSDKMEEGSVQKLDSTGASATENTNEGGSTVEVGNDNISDTEIIAALENLQREMSKHEGRPEESLLQQNEPENENLERSFSKGFEDIHTAASSAYAETITCVSEETPIKSHEEIFEEKGKGDTSIRNDAAGENGIPTEKNLPPTELNEKIGSVEAEITNKNPKDLHVTHPLVEEGEQKECEELNKDSKFEVEEVHEATGASKGEEKHVEDNPGECQSTNSAILEHTSKEEAVTTELTPKTSEIGTEIFQEICELDSEENLKSKEAGEKIKEATQKEEACDAETSQITTKIKTISDTETSVMVKSNVLARDETIELNSEVESTLEAAPAVSYEDESNKAEDNEERSNIITDEAQDGPKIIVTGEATNEEIIQGNITCLSPELIEKETFQSSQDNENRAEKSKGEDSGEQIIEESNGKDLSPEAIDESPVKIFQDDEKEEKKSEEEIFEASETAEAGKSIAYETSQTVESPKDMLDTSMVIQEEGRNLAPAEGSPEEKSNEDKPYVVVGEENSTDTKLDKVKRNFEEGEDDSKQILQKKETGEMFDTSQLKKEEGLQSEDKNLTPPEASPEEKRNEDRPSGMMTEEIGRDAELVENAGNVEKCEEDSKQILQKYEAGEMLDTSLVKQEEILQNKGKNLNLTEASPEEKGNDDSVIGAEENGSDTEPVETKGNVEKDEEDYEETEAVTLNSDKMEEGSVQKLDSTGASATENTNEGGSTVEVGNDNISDAKIIAAVENLQREMSKQEGRPEESLLQQNEPENENLERSLSKGFEDIHTAASSAYAETITCISEETPIKSHEEGFEEKGKEDTSIKNDAAGENGIPTEKNLPPTELNEKTGIVKAEITNKNPNDLHVTHSLVEEGEPKEYEELNKVSNFEPEEVHEATVASKGEEKHVEDNPGECQSTNSVILEHTSKEEAVTTELTPKTSEIDTEIFQEICELNSEENLKSKEAGEKIKEATQKEEACDAETSQITTKSDDTVKTISDTETSVMFKSNVLARDERDETIELNSEVESTVEAAPAVSYEDESNKAEDNEERSNIITDEVQDGPKIIDTGGATNEEIIQGNITCLSPELIEKETFQSSQDNENNAEKSKGDDSGEQIIEESNVKDLPPEAIEEGPVKIFQDDEKEEKESEGEIFEASETAEAGKSIAYETSQTVESPKDMLDTSMVIQEEGRNLAPAESSPEEKSNEDKSYVIVGEENSTDTKLDKVKRNFEEGEDDSKQILQKKETGEMFDTSQLKQEEGLQSEDKNLTPPEASPEEKRNEDRPSGMMTEEIVRDAELVENAGNVEKCEEDSKQILQKYEAGEMLDTSLVKQEEILQNEGKNLNLTEASPEEKRNEDSVLGAEENGSDTELVETKGNVDKDEEDYEETEAVTLKSDKMEEGSFQKLDSTGASAMGNTNEGGSTVEVGNDNISDTEIIAAVKNLQREMSKHEGRPEEGLLQQNEPENENVERSLSKGFEDIHTAASSAYAETITCVSEETPIKSHEEGFEEKGKEDTSIQNDAAGENGIPTEKNLPPTELNEKTGSVEAEITNKNPNDLQATHPLVEEGEQKECEELNKVSKFEAEEVHEATGASKGEEKHVEDNPGACQITNNAILEHTSKEETLTTELTPKTSEIDTEIFQEICELDSEENLKSEEAGEKIEEAIQKDEACDAETSQITTKSDDTVKTISDAETSVMVKSNVFAGDDTIQQNSEVESTLEAAPAVSCEDESKKAENNEERSNITNEQVQDGPKITDIGEATNEQIIQRNITCLSPELIEKETIQSSQDNENKAEKSKGEDSGEQIIEESNNKELSPEVIEESPVENFQDDEKETKKSEGEIFEGSETAETGKSIAHETIQTIENPKDMNDSSMVIQEESKNLAPAEASPEEKRNEDRSSVVVGEENSTDTEVVKVKRNFEEGEDDSKQILQKNETREMFDASLLKQEDLQNEDENLTPPDEKRNEDRPSVMITEDIGRDAELVENAGNLEKCEEDSKQILQKNEAGEILDTSLVKQEELLQNEGKNLNSSEASPEEKRNVDLVSGAEENGSDTKPVEPKGNVEKYEENSEEIEAVTPKSDKMEEGAVQNLDETLDKEEKDKETNDDSCTKNNLNAKVEDIEPVVETSDASESTESTVLEPKSTMGKMESETSKNGYKLDSAENLEGTNAVKNIEEQINTETKEEYEGSEIVSTVEETETHVIREEYGASDITPEIMKEETTKSSEGDENEKQMPKVKEYECSEVVSKVEETETHIIKKEYDALDRTPEIIGEETETKEEYEGSEVVSKVEKTETHINKEDYGASDITPELIGEETIKSSEGDENEKQMSKVEEYKGSEIVSKVEETETHVIKEEYGASDITPKLIGEETIKSSEGDENEKQMPKVEEYEGSEVVSMVEETKTHIIKEEYVASDITPEIIGEETIKNSEGDENEKQMPKEVNEELKTISESEDAEKQILEEENTIYNQSTVLDGVEKTEQSSEEDNMVAKVPKQEGCERIQTEDIKQNIEEGSTAEDRKNLGVEPEEEVCKEFETAALTTSTENQNTEEHTKPGLPLREETVKESSKEDESDTMQLKEEVHDSNSALIEETETTGSAEETTSDTLKEPKNDPHDLHIIKAREEDGDLVDNSLVLGVSKKDIKEEISAKGETTINDSDSVTVVVETEGTSYEEAEAQDKMQVESSDLDSQETDLAATETKGTMLDSVDSSAKPENSSNLGEKQNETIPTETDGAGEKMEYERQDKVPDAGSEGQKEETTIDTCSKDILGDDLKENSTMPPKEHRLMTTEVHETTEETPEKFQAPYENVEAPFIAQATDEKMMQKEDKPTDSIDDSKFRSVDTGNENEDEEVHKHRDEDLFVHPVLDTEQYISKSEDVENLKREETGDVADQIDISESKSVKDEESSSQQLEKETNEDRKPLDEASKGFETFGTCTDGEKNILEEENFAKSVVDSSKEGVEVENAAVEFEGGAHSHGHEVTSSKDDGTPTEENLESADPDERLKCASKLVAEEQSNETLLESNNSQIEGNSNDIQDQEKEIKEEKEPKLEPEDRSDTEQKTNETIKAVILSEEVHEGVEKADDDDIVKEQMIEEESGVNELHTVISKDEADNDDIVKEQVIEEESGVNELHTVITKDETINEVKDSSPQFAEYVKATDANREATVKKESEEEKAKEGGSEKPVDVSISPAEESEEKIENIIEETQNYYNKNDTATGTAVTAETSLREAQLDDKLVKRLNISADETSLETTENLAIQQGNRVDSTKLEETSCDLASQIPANDHEHAEKESGTLQNPNVAEDEEVKISCGAVFESKDQETEETDETGKGPNVEKLDVGETEEASIIVPDYKSQGVEAIIEDEITADLTLPAEKPEEQLQTPLPFEEQKHVTTTTVDREEEDKTKEAEKLEDESPEDSSAAKTTEETFLQMEVSRELKVPKLGLELNDEDIKHNSTEVHEEERETMDEVKEDTETVCETESKSESQGIEAVTEDEITTDQTVLVETPSSTLLFKDQGQGTVTTMEKTEEKTKEVEMLQDDSPEISSAPKTTEETCPQTEEPSELELSQLVLDLNKDMQKECPNEVQKEEGGTLDKIQEASETVWQSKSEGVEAAKITADQTLPVEISAEQHQTPSSALLCKEQEHETTRTIENIEEKTKEVEMLQDESPENSFATKTTEETCLQMVESRELEVSQLGLELNKDMQEDSPTEVHEEERGTLDEGKEDTGKASETGSKSESQVIEAVTEDEITVDQTVLEEKPSTTLLLKEQEHGTVVTMEKTEEKIKEVEMLQDDIPENSSVQKTTEETCPQREEPSELELSQLGLDLDKDMQKECPNEVQKEGGTLEKIKEENKEASETVWQSKSESIEAANITADQALPLEISEEQHQTPSSVLLCEKQEHETTRTIENIEEKTKEVEMLQVENPENSSATKTTKGTCLQMVESRELEVSQLGLELNKDMQKDSPNEVPEEERATLDEVKEEIGEASETASKSRDHGSEAATEDAIIAHQRLPEDKLEEQHQTPSAALLSRVQKHGTTTMIENVEETMKELEIPKHGNLEYSSAPQTTEETCLQKVELKELEVTEDIEKDGPNETNVEEGKTLDKDVKVEPQEYEVEMKYESLSESEKVTELTRPFEEASSAKSEISEKAFESGTEIHGQDVLTKSEDTEIKLKHSEDAITGLKAEDNQHEKIIEATEIVQNEVLIEQIKEEEEDTKNCQPVSPGEDTFKESHSEFELKAEENLGENKNEIFKTRTFQKEELYEEIKKAGASENIVKHITAEEKIVENETIKEELGKDVKEAASIVDLQNRREETNFGDDATKATVLREEELGVEITQNEGTMDPAEAFEVTRDIQPQEKTSHAASEKQLSREAEPNPSIEVMSAGKKDVPIVDTLQDSKVGDSEPGYAAVVDSGVKEYEHGGEKRKDDSGDITIEEFTSMNSPKISLCDLIQRSTRETPQVAGHLTEEKEPMARKEEMHVEDMRTVVRKDEEEEGDQHQKSDSGPDAPVMVEASKDMDVKVAHKKHHNILSGVGSKVKHSISKVKKALTGKSFHCSHPEPVSPK